MNLLNKKLLSFIAILSILTTNISMAAFNSGVPEENPTKQTIEIIKRYNKLNALQKEWALIGIGYGVLTGATIWASSKGLERVAKLRVEKAILMVEKEALRKNIRRVTSRCREIKLAAPLLMG